MERTAEDAGGCRGAAAVAGRCSGIGRGGEHRGREAEAVKGADIAMVQVIGDRESKRGGEARAVGMRGLGVGAGAGGGGGRGRGAGQGGCRSCWGAGGWQGCKKEGGLEICWVC